jgi:hypothetical protein
LCFGVVCFRWLQADRIELTERIELLCQTSSTELLAELQHSLDLLEVTQL